MSDAELKQPPDALFALTRALPIAFLSVGLATLGSLLFPPTNWMPADVPHVAFTDLEAAQ